MHPHSVFTRLSVILPQESLHGTRLLSELILIVYVSILYVTPRMRVSYGALQHVHTYTKGLSTAEGGRGHVTTYMYCVTIKIQTLRPDIL